MPLVLVVHISMEPPLPQPVPAQVVPVTGQELLQVPELHVLIPLRHVWQVDVRSAVQPFWHCESPAAHMQKHWKNEAQSAVTQLPLQLSTVHCQHPVLIWAEVHDGPLNGNAPELEPLPPSPMLAVRPPHAKQARSAAAATATGATSESFPMYARSLPPQGQAILAACSAAMQPDVEHDVQSKICEPT